ncbi:TPA: hypothetical protein ACGN8S_005250 [Bacillus cereus]
MRVIPTLLTHNDLIGKVKCNDTKEHEMQIFNSMSGEVDECFAGVFYGIRLVREGDVIWENILLETSDSGIISDLSNYNRSRNLKVVESIAQYYQFFIYKCTGIRCKIMYDFKAISQKAFEYDEDELLVRSYAWLESAD